MNDSLLQPNLSCPHNHQERSKPIHLSEAGWLEAETDPFELGHKHVGRNEN
jgi:hypothetical protein